MFVHSFPLPSIWGMHKHMNTNRLKRERKKTNKFISNLQGLLFLLHFVGLTNISSDFSATMAKVTHCKHPAGPRLDQYLANLDQIMVLVTIVSLRVQMEQKSGIVIMLQLMPMVIARAKDILWHRR